MDKNKLQVLRDISYQIKSTCGTCTFGRFDGKSISWGTCDKYEYEHLKHTNSVRELSIYIHGYCGEYVDSGHELSILSHFTEFLQMNQLTEWRSVAADLILLKQDKKAFGMILEESPELETEYQRYVKLLERIFDVAADWIRQEFHLPPQ